MDYYNKIASGYNELHKEEQLKKLELIKRHVNFEGLVLDIGAGTGISSEYWRNAKVISLEPAFEMLKQSKCEKVQAKAEELPFKDEIFDGIISLTALHHADLKEALKEIKRVSKKNAKIVLSFLKKSANKPKNLKGFNKIEEDKDIIFIKN
ncbi:MAG TPA: class I SAM-dependent methyltransferase [Candidatus Nanoarchaeia archaeon]|nr:class I SAM-dependent methyltransferase [Candidatus Nanoarchaeia archaeon]